MNKPLSFPAGVSDWSKDILSKMLVIDEGKRIGWDDLFKLAVKKEIPGNTSRSKNEFILDGSR